MHVSLVSDINLLLLLDIWCEGWSVHERVMLCHGWVLVNTPVYSSNSRTGVRRSGCRGPHLHYYSCLFQCALQDPKKKPNSPPTKPVPYVARKLFRQDKDSKAPDNSKLAPVKENTLVDLMSSWDSSAQTAPGIQSFIKDESQILQPIKPGEEAEDENTVENESNLDDLYSVPAKRKPEREGAMKYSVERLSQIFEKAAASQESSPVHAGTGDRTTKAKRSKSPPQSPESKPLPPLPTAETPATRPATEVIYDQPPLVTDEEFLYQVLYDYNATDNTELTIKEGDLVISVAGFTAGMQPGWLMVRQEGELDEGWVPESYVKKLGPVYEPEPVGGSGLPTGQIMSPENQSPACKL